MADPLHLVEQRLADAFATVAGQHVDPVVRPSDRADAQANGALAVAKALGRSPRDVAAEVAAAAQLDGIAHIEIAGPGFLNLTFAADWLGQLVAETAADDRLGIPAAATPERVVVDYSAPNVAKEMHAGHLRTTLIGDAFVRIMSFLGHTVIKENHIGDWGTPFGMLIEHLLDIGGTGDATTMEVRDLNGFYQAARVKFDADPAFADRARERVVKLQSRDDLETTALWKALVRQSTLHFNEIYSKLGILLTDDDLAGESMYQPSMPLVLERLADVGLLDESDGAKVVWVDGYTNRDGDPLPLIVQARTGGFNYATSDLACVIDRTERLGATLMLYCIGTPQAQHLNMVWAVAEMAGFMHGARAVHVNNGNVLGADKKMLKSRSGDPVRFIELIDEAVNRGTAMLRARVAEGRSDVTDDEAIELGRMIGIGGLKYAELSADRIRDYVLDFDRMLAFEGNTAPYLQYAHARIRSIFRKASIDPATIRTIEPSVAEPQERTLVLRLLGYSAALGATVESFSPHKLCTYLFDLAQDFSAFYEACPILKDGVDGELRLSRLALADLTARTLQHGLGLLGIDVPERM